MPTANELAGARYQGRKIAEVANKLQTRNEGEPEMQKPASIGAKENVVEVHPLDPDDAPITAAIRAMSSAAKGVPPGIEGRVQFDALMESVLRHSRRIQSAAYRGCGFFLEGGDRKKRFSIYTVAGSILGPQMRIAILSGI